VGTFFSAEGPEDDELRSTLLALGVGDGSTVAALSARFPGGYGKLALEAAVMDEATVRRLIEGGETLDVEFKGDVEKPFSDRDLVEAVVCLANRTGGSTGWLLVGVEDDGRVTGVRERHGPVGVDPLRIRALVTNRTRPSINVEVHVVPIDGRSVLAIGVEPSETPVGTADGRYVRRAVLGHGVPGCVPFHFHEMLTRRSTRGGLDYTELVVPDLTFDDLDPFEFERFRRIVRENPGRGDEALVDLSDVDLAKALGAVEANHDVRAVRILGLLLFGKTDALRRHLPTHEVAFQVMDGELVRVNEFYRLPLLRLFDEFLILFRAHHREQELLVGMFRVAIPDYSPRALREGLANALVHRDFSRLGAVHVQYRTDSVEITNPGGLPEGVRLDNILTVPPRPRNPLLADALKRVGLVERTARGVDTIFLEQLRNGRMAPDYGRTTDATVSLVLPGGAANLEFVRLIHERAAAGRSLTLDELLALNAVFFEKTVSTKRLAGLIQKGMSQARGVLNGLVDIGLLEGRGTGERLYHLAPDVSRKLGRPVFAERLVVDDDEALRCVLARLDEHGVITRREVAETCRLSPFQASRLLARCEKQGLIERRGQGRSTTYIRSGSKEGS